MKQLLLFPTFIFCLLVSFSGYSQYKIEEQRHYSYEDNTSEWEYDAAMEYSYDNEGDKETSLLTLGMPDSENVMRVDNQYNANNLIISSVTYYWDDTEMLWQDTSKTDYDYDGANLITKTSQGNNFGTSTYSNTYRIGYTYSGANMTSETRQNWNNTTKEWVNDERDLYEYSGSDVTLYTEQEWENGVWVNDEETKIDYESAGKPSQTIVREWNSGINDWELDERVTYSYSGNLMTEALGEDYIGGAWVLDHRTQFTYENGLLTEMVYQERKGNAWESDDRYLYTYDANGNNTLFIIEEWDNEDEEWELESKIETDYSSVKAFALSSESFDIDEFKIYPNPASNVIHISSVQPIEKMELYDVLGKKVRSSSNMKQLNVESLKSGMYMLRVYDKKSSTTKKIVIK